MTGQHDWQDERLTGQLSNQSGHCPLTGRYFEPCLLLKDILRELHVLVFGTQALVIQSESVPSYKMAHIHIKGYYLFKFTELCSITRIEIKAYAFRKGKSKT